MIGFFYEENKNINLVFIYLTYFLFFVHVQTCFFFFFFHQLTLQTLNFKSCLVFCLVTCRRHGNVVFSIR